MQPLGDRELANEALVAPRSATVTMPDTVIEDRPGWYFMLTPSLKEGGLNGVASVMLDASDADRVIDETIARYAEHGVRFRWTVSAECRPTDLADRLARRGLRETPSRVMWRSTSLDASTPAGITVREVDARELDLLADVVARGWGVHDVRAWRDYQRRCFEHPARRHRFFLARLDGEPVGGAGYIALDRSAYLVGGVVLADHRGHGVYRALVEARVAHAAKAGLSIATSIAREDTSAPILEHLGFGTVCVVRCFSNDPPKP